MARNNRVSRTGFTTCTSCRSHIKFNADDVACPFCATPFAARTSSSVIERAMNAGRSSVLAASLLGLASAGPMACDSEEETGADMASDAAEDLGVQPAYGVPADLSGPSDVSTPDAASPDVASPDVVEDLGVQPAYGVPADIAEDTGQAADLGPQPAYGIAADGQ